MDVLYRDAELLVVAKPSGLITHRGWANDRDTALSRARALAGRHVYPVHRLDRATSGVLAFALTETAAAALGEQIEAGGVDKRYLALVRGLTPEAFEVDHPLRSLEAGPEAPKKPARSSFARLGTFERYSLLEAIPHTGRAHQLRRHLKHLSHPILGDTRYGDGRHNRAGRERFGLLRLALHAARLSFTHPTTGERIECRAPLPPDLHGPLSTMCLLDAATRAIGTLALLAAVTACGDTARGIEPASDAGATDSDAYGDTAQGSAPASDAGATDSDALTADPFAPEDCVDDRDGITLTDLLTEMIDLRHLTKLPAEPYLTHLQSSHNPRSDTAAPGDADWHADGDFIDPPEGVTETLLDVAGPGVITRIWSASPDGTLRVFLDGAEEPVIEADFAQLLRGDLEPFRAPYGFVAAFGHNLYFPIAYARSCRVTLTGGSDPSVVYYHIAHRSYPEGTVVEPFDAGAVAAARCAYERTAARLRDPAQPIARASDETTSFDLDSGAGEAQAATIEAPQGGGVLRELTLSPELTAPDLLRATALVIEMDGEITVRAPLLDFFASGLEGGEVESLPVIVDSTGTLIARWPMPFARVARLWLEHAGAGELVATLDVTFAADPFTEDSLYFRAGWHAPVQLVSEPPYDHTLAEAEGSGYYVGNTLDVLNPATGWWGEGDERIYVDGETFPSHFGTGTEDYYGYAWCSNERFGTPYIGQTASTTHKSFGGASLYRFHVLDPIPFTASLRFDLEIRHWGDPVEMTYDSTSFWYARPGATISGARATDATFRLPELDVAPPDDVAEGPYRCGG